MTNTTLPIVQKKLDAKKDNALFTMNNCSDCGKKNLTQKCPKNFTIYDATSMIKSDNKRQGIMLNRCSLKVECLANLCQNCYTSHITNHPIMSVGEIYIDSDVSILSNNVDNIEEIYDLYNN